MKNIAAYPLVNLFHSQAQDWDWYKHEHVQQPSDINFAMKYLANNKPPKNVLKAGFNNFRRMILQNNVTKKFSKAAWSIKQPFEREQKRNYN